MSRRKIVIDVDDASELSYGKKVYVVGFKKYGSHQSFAEKCPVCDDTKEIEYKGYKFKCPHCTGNVAATTICVSDFDVLEYIINKFEISGSDYKNAYTADGQRSERNLPSVTWYGFTRWGNGYTDVMTRRFNMWDFREVDPDKVDIKRYSGDRCFFTKATANKFCKRLHERQKEMLEKFNAEHGTDHQYPFEY